VDRHLVPLRGVRLLTQGRTRLCRLTCVSSLFVVASQWHSSGGAAEKPTQIHLETEGKQAFSFLYRGAAAAFGALGKR
jgi:hypothetical protein